MNIPVNTIPNEGLHLTWNKLAELKEIQDICVVEQTQITLNIKPFDKGYDVSGTIDTLSPLDCSYCTNSLNIPVHEDFHEIVLLEKPKNSSNIPGELEVQFDEADVSYVEDNAILLGPLIRELIQINQPIQPKCKEQGGGPNAPSCIADWDYKSYFEETSNPLSPFQALKDFKVSTEKKVDNQQEKRQLSKSKKSSR